MKKYDSKKVAAAFLLAIGATGCGALIAPNPMQRGHVALVADAEGMRAFSDMASGLVTEGKTPAGMKGAYWQHREIREAEETKRETAPGFLSGLFARPANQGGVQ